MKPMRILVTGGAGFIGSHTVDALVSAGHSVAVFDDLTTGRRSNVNHNALLSEIDVTERNETEVAMDAFQPEAIFHFAAQVSVPHSFAAPADDGRINVLGLLNVLHAARNLPTKPRFVFISSGGAVYGDALELPSSEKTTPNPATPYGIAKLACEQYVRLLAPSSHVVLRFSNVYGPRQGGSKETGVCAVFTQQMREGKPLSVLGDGSQTRDYVYVQDVASACVVALDRGEGEVINIASGVETSTDQLATLFVGIAKRGEIVHLPERPGDVKRSWLNPAKAAVVLGWEPETTLEAGLATLLATE
jgi:UDP-glucose 4-epimerase